MAGTDRRKRVLIPIAAGSDEFEMACLRTILWEFGAEVVLARVLAPSSLASSTKSSNFVVMHQGTKVSILSIAALEEDVVECCSQRCCTYTPIILLLCASI
jgi:hypothetical protein